MALRYSIQEIDSKTDGTNFRITDNQSDSRISTSYLKENAELVCDALNFYNEYFSTDHDIILMPRQD